MIYPDDDNGDVLRRLEAHGDDLTRPRNIDFVVVFPDEESAKTFAEHFRAQGYSVSVDLIETKSESSWDVNVLKHMVPIYEQISFFEDALQEAAKALGGHNDGWGCMAQGTNP